MAELRLYNGELCNYEFTTNSSEIPMQTVDSIDFTVLKSINVGSDVTFSYTLKSASGKYFENKDHTIEGMKTYTWF